MFLTKTQFPCNPLSFQIWTSIHSNIFNLSIIHLLMWWLNSCNIKFHLQGSYHQIMVSVALIFWNSKEQKLIHLICGIHTSKASDHSVENLYYYCAYLNKKMKIFSVFVYTDDACSLFKLTFFSSSLTLSKLIYWYMYMYFQYSLSSPMILSIFYSCVKKLVNGGNRNLINWGILSTKKFVLCRWHCKEINIGCRIN